MLQVLFQPYFFLPQDIASQITQPITNCARTSTDSLCALRCAKSYSQIDLIPLYWNMISTAALYQVTKLSFLLVVETTWLCKVTLTFYLCGCFSSPPHPTAHLSLLPSYLGPPSRPSHSILLLLSFLLNDGLLELNWALKDHLFQCFPKKLFLAIPSCLGHAEIPRPGSNCATAVTRAVAVTIPDP